MTSWAKLRWAASLLALVLLAGPRPALAEATTRRFALLVGNNEGGPGTRALYYAHDDARRIHALLLRLGGVRPGDARLLLEARAVDVERALDALEARAAQASAEGHRTILLVYYSGHAKDGALRLGDTRLELEWLKRRLVSVRADVRIGIVDSCRSGAINRLKGARRAPAFDVDSGPTEARGTVMLTASSGDEDAQESDHLGGSYFTHHFASGLLGEADRSGDGRVTLSEAYAYAYDRTVASTAATLAGPQHPTYDYDLAGNGDVVLTDLGARGEALVLAAAAPAGTYFLLDGAGRVVAEVQKGEGAARRVALAPGRYTVKRRMDDRLRIGEVTVEAGRERILDESRLRDAPFTDDPVKGSGRQGPRLPTAFSLVASLQSFMAGEDLFPTTALLGLETELPGVFGPEWLLGLDFALGGREAVLELEGLSPLTYAYGEVGLGASILRTFRLGPATPFAGARLGLVLMTRRFEAASALPDQFFSTVSPGLVVGSRLRLLGGLSLAARLRLHYLHYQIDEDRSLGWSELGLLVVYEP